LEALNKAEKEGRRAVEAMESNRGMKTALLEMEAEVVGTLEHRNGGLFELNLTLILTLTGGGPASCGAV